MIEGRKVLYGRHLNKPLRLQVTAQVLPTTRPPMNVNLSVGKSFADIIKLA